MRSNTINLALVFILLTACKIGPFSSLKEAGSGADANLTIAIQDSIPSHLVLFLDVMNGKAERMHDYYFTSVLPGALGSIGTISDEIKMTFSQTASDLEGNSVDFAGEHIYKGIQIGQKIFVFKRENGGVGSAEKGPWWLPVKMYPASILASQPLEEKIRHCLNTEIYEKIQLGERMEYLDAVEVLFHFIPAYGGAQKYFYEGQTMGLVWIVGDIASLGMAAKAEALANVARATVIGTSSIRIANGAYQVVTGQGSGATGIDVALATVEGGLALMGLVNLKLKLPKGAAPKDIDELIDTMGAERVFLADRGSAESLARRLGRDIDDILGNGITREEIAKLANRQLVAKATEVTGGRIFPGAKVSFSKVVEELDLQKINASLRKIDEAVPLTFDEALELSTLGINKDAGNLFWNVQKNLDVIFAEDAMANRFRANRTHVFSTETPISLDTVRQAMIQGVQDGVRKGHVIFQGEAAKLFQKHPVWGLETGVKRWVFKEFQTKGFGDLVIDAATRMDETTLVITKAHIATAADAGGRFATGLGASKQWSAQVFRVGSDIVATPVIVLGAPGLATMLIMRAEQQKATATPTPEAAVGQ